MQCRMLAVATGKLQLEHLVIEKGHFKQEKESSKVDLQVSVAYSHYVQFVGIRCL